NSRADLNASTESPTEVIKSVRASRMDESSSTTNTIGSPVFMRCLQLQLAKEIGMSRQRGRFAGLLTARHAPRLSNDRSTSPFPFLLVLLSRMLQKLLSFRRRLGQPLSRALQRERPIAQRDRVGGNGFVILWGDR